MTEQNASDHILLTSQFVAGSAATTADQHVVYNASTGALYYDADGNGAGRDGANRDTGEKLSYHP